ncbi:hypothetical protein MUN84_21795 [Hymenobacter sp. 5516J-16]|nr:hypothetical protein [Hymenobacter sp. 5516J-16]UOQ77057.1 hypothetical protein MUN84_21795 [Hymenobacter sp. 5516J-16]
MARALVTTVCVLGVVPYISLQIKAIAASFDILTGGGETSLLAGGG